jgi:branched-chain amino acid transport system permease protein
MSGMAIGRPEAGRAWRALLPWAVAAVAAAALPFLLPGGFALSLLCRMAIAIVFALSFNMLLGQGGMLDFGHAVFLGFGGFLAVHALRLAEAGWWIPAPAVPLVGAAGGLAAALLAGWVATRRSGTAFAMITLGVAELAVALVLLSPGVFGGEEGISGDRSAGPRLFGFDFGTQIQAYAVIAAWAWAAALLMWFYTRTPLGRLANAVRDNPERVAFLGYDPARIRLLVFALSGLFAGVAGGLAALNDEIATSANMGSEASGAVLLMTFIGGIGIFWGPVIGAAVITLLSVALSTVTDAWQLYSGLLFVAMVVWAPGGIAGILAAHAPAMRAGRLWRLAPSYLATLPGFAELGFRLQAVRNGAAPPPVFGVVVDPGAAWPWAAGCALALAGAAWLNRTAPRARAAWQEAA